MSLHGILQIALNLITCFYISMQFAMVAFTSVRGGGGGGDD